MSRTDRGLRDCVRTMSAALVASIGLSAAETAPATGACWRICLRFHPRLLNRAWRRMCTVIRLAWNSVLA
jgi:hypothetical protein